MTGTTQIQVKVLQARSVALKRNYAGVMGIGVGENIRECLQPRCHGQLYEDVFKYKKILPWTYLSHLEDKGVILDELQIIEMITNYKRGWYIKKHITTFAMRLDRDQKKTKKDKLIILDANKKQHLMVKVWAQDLFDCPVMIK